MISLRARKLILDLAVSLDGFIEGPKGETDWCIMDPDMKFNDFLKGIDIIFYGRKSYDIWGEYIPGNNASDTEKEMWDLVHSKKKYVFSKTLQTTDKNVIIIKNNIPEEVNKLKNQAGKDIWLYGGASLVKNFMDLGLVDEFRLSVHPIILGTGKPLFTDIKKRHNLKLTGVREFSSGVVQLCYSSL